MPHELHVIFDELDVMVSIFGCEFDRVIHRLKITTTPGTYLPFPPPPHDAEAPTFQIAQIADQDRVLATIIHDEGISALEIFQQTLHSIPKIMEPLVTNHTVKQLGRHLMNSRLTLQRQESTHLCPPRKIAPG